MWTPRYGLHAVIVLAVLGRLAAAQESPEQILQQAITWHQKGDVERAIPQYREYLRIRPEASDVRSNLGAALASTGRYERAILIASRVRQVARPEPTHYDDRKAMQLWGTPWVPMADALGWGATGRPAPTTTAGGTATGGAEPFGHRD